jgi:hypothetical protein
MAGTAGRQTASVEVTASATADVAATPAGSASAAVVALRPGARVGAPARATATECTDAGARDQRRPRAGAGERAGASSAGGVAGVRVHETVNTGVVGPGSLCDLHSGRRALR